MSSEICAVSGNIIAEQNSGAVTKITFIPVLFVLQAVVRFGESWAAQTLRYQKLQHTTMQGRLLKPPPKFALGVNRT